MVPPLIPPKTEQPSSLSYELKRGRVGANVLTKTTIFVSIIMDLATHACVAGLAVALTVAFLGPWLKCFPGMYHVGELLRVWLLCLASLPSSWSIFH